jgi:hypothetical protein
LVVIFVGFFAILLLKERICGEQCPPRSDHLLHYTIVSSPSFSRFFTFLLPVNVICTLLRRKILGLNPLIMYMAYKRLSRIWLETAVCLALI